MFFSESIKKDHQTSYKYNNEILKPEGQSEFLSRFIYGQSPTKMRKNGQKIRYNVVIAIISYESTLQWIKNSKVGQAIIICDEMVAKIDNLN